MIEVKGADQLADLAKALKQAGDKDLQRELYAAINRAVKPVRADIKQSARSNLPRRGGLAADVARSSITTRRRSSVSRASGVQIVARNAKLSLHHLNKGQVRHPLKSGGFTIQRIKPGWFSGPTEAAASDVRNEILKALNTVSAKLNRKRN